MFRRICRSVCASLIWLQNIAGRSYLKSTIRDLIFIDMSFVNYNCKLQARFVRPVLQRNASSLL